MRSDCLSSAGDVLNRCNFYLGARRMLATLGVIWALGVVPWAFAQAPTAPPETPMTPAPVVPPPAPPAPGAEITPAPAGSQLGAPAGQPTPVPAVPAPADGATTQAAEVVYESQPARDIAKEGGAVPEEEAQALPAAEPESPKATIIAEGLMTEDVLSRIREQTGVQITAMGAAKAQQMGRLTFQDMSVEDILDAITVPRQWIWVKHSDGTYEIYDKDTYVKTVQAGQVIRYPFQLKYIDAEELDKVIKTVLTPVIGASAVDARTNKLIVTDLPDKISLIKQIIEEYDVQQFSRVFEIQHADVEDIGERLGEIKSKAAEIQVDPRNRIIVVKDTFEKIKEMEQLIELLDRDIEMRIYNLNNIGAEGADALDLLEKFIEPLVTPDALFDYNEATAKLLVRDIPAVHKKIEDLLMQLDQPKKQVLIEGEILSVAQDFTKNWGADWAIARDLNSAIEGGLDIGGFVSDNDLLQKGLPAATGGAAGLNVFELTDHVRLQLVAALSDSRTRLLMRPRILIANKENGIFQVTRNEPVLNTYFYDSDQDLSNSRSSGQQLVTTGLVVDILPEISNRGLVELDIAFENSTPIIVPDIGNDQRGVGSAEESAETTLIIPSGETRVIGGLISNNETDSTTGIPYLSQIPYLGFLFGSKNNINNQRNLMFFITPTIIEEKPQNNIVIEPVNEMARQAMTATAAPVAVPEDVNVIPPELRPYLEQIMPEPKPLPGARVPAEAPEGAIAPTAVPDEAATPTAPGAPVGPGAALGPGAPLPIAPGQATVTGQGLLTDQPYVEPQVEGSLKVGGAVEQVSPTIAGPSGTFGATERAVVAPKHEVGETTGTAARRRRTPEATPTPYPSRRRPTPTPTPEPTAAPTPVPEVTPVPTPIPTPAP